MISGATHVFCNSHDPFAERGLPVFCERRAIVAGSAGGG
ncbi:hypothetical protein SAMN04515668_4378 [Hymenobacter arizonensis]|uniref:Uncharacterized protein n=1 Tax=Hymenobacter arizonensis TaxID=1227077 RepID=A0A1I6BDA1_HYMAR|nr:hypothetical protein SAMN04515668_4378 [Hymenobacter arizonensis]